jgi:hypothetical protein
MKQQSKNFLVLTGLFLLMGLVTLAQNSTDLVTTKTTNEPVMKTYLIERDIPGAGKLGAAQLKGISQKSCSVLTEMGPQIQWVHSYVTGDKIFCIYKAENEELLREHAKRGGFPINKVMEIANMISPATAK